MDLAKIPSKILGCTFEFYMFLEEGFLKNLVKNPSNTQWSSLSGSVAQEGTTGCGTTHPAGAPLAW